MSENNCCCCSSGGYCGTPVIQTVSTRLTIKDRFGGWKVRWGIGRMSYTVEPGIYAVGKPDANAPVLVSANYKLTFDSLRKELSGVDCWLLILDTKGVNVWCAAGKGTFGTNELIHRIEASRLSEIVAHKTLILPQLGASGINANEIKNQSGFSVVYGPVRASDIKEFLRSGNKATEERLFMRMEQVIGNIITNSYKYANTDIDVDFKICEDVLQIQINDYGSGVNSDEIELICTKFYRGENAKVSQKDGEGLGLYIAKLLMEKMGGGLEAFNREDGFGIRLWVQLSH